MCVLGCHYKIDSIVPRVPSCHCWKISLHCCNIVGLKWGIVSLSPSHVCTQPNNALQRFPRASPLSISLSITSLLFPSLPHTDSSKKIHAHTPILNNPRKRKKKQQRVFLHSQAVAESPPLSLSSLCIDPPLTHLSARSLTSPDILLSPFFVCVVMCEFAPLTATLTIFLPPLLLVKKQ